MRGGRKKKKFLGFQESGCFLFYTGGRYLWAGTEVGLGQKFK
jgi:hypothetical protein